MWRLRSLGCEPSEASLSCLATLCKKRDPNLLALVFDFWFSGAGVGGQAVFQPWNPGAEIEEISCFIEYPSGGGKERAPSSPVKYLGDEESEGGEEESGEDQEPEIVDIIARSTLPSGEKVVYGVRCVRVLRNIICYPYPFTRDTR